MTSTAKMRQTSAISMTMKATTIVAGRKATTSSILVYSDHSSSCCAGIDLATDIVLLPLLVSLPYAEDSRTEV